MLVLSSPVHSISQSHSALETKIAALDPTFSVRNRFPGMNSHWNDIFPQCCHIHEQ